MKKLDMEIYFGLLLCISLTQLAQFAKGKIFIKLTKFQKKCYVQMVWNNLKFLIWNYWNNELIKCVDFIMNFITTDSR